MRELERLRSALRRSAPAVPASKDQWSRLASDPRARIAPRRSASGIAFAAAIAAVAVLAIGRARVGHAPAVPWIEASDRGVRQSLDDGTTISLEPGASGKLAEARGDYVRFELRRGRAHFDVTPNQRRTFHVTASGYDVRVLGTRFDVELPPDGEPISVSVERGSVSVTVPGAAEPIVLLPGDRLGGPRDRPEVRHGASGDALEISHEDARGAFSSGKTVEPAPSGPTVEPSAPPAPLVAASSSARPGGRNPSQPPREPAHSASSDWFKLYRDGQYAASLEAARASGFQRLLRELGPDQLAALADAARFGGDASSSMAALAAIERRFPGSAEAAQATFLLGRLHALRGDAAGAVADFERYLNRYPTGTYSTEAMGRLAELHSKQGNRLKAKEMAQRYLERAPDGPYARLARSLVNP